MGISVTCNMDRVIPRFCEANEECDFEPYIYDNGVWLCRTHHDERKQFL